MTDLKRCPNCGAQIESHKCPYCGTVFYDFAEQQWIPITSRPMTEDERQEWSEKLGYDIEYDEAVMYGNLPDDGQRVLVYNKYSGEVVVDTFYDDYDGCYFEEDGEMYGITPTYWMPLPEPPKEG